MCGVPIRYFRLNNEIYIHQIFPSEDDRIELVDNDQNVILTFDSSMRVFNTDKKQIGKIFLEYDRIIPRELGDLSLPANGKTIWVFRTLDGSTEIKGKSSQLSESHIDLEVEVSKWHLISKFQ